MAGGLGRGGCRRWFVGQPALLDSNTVVGFLDADDLLHQAADAALREIATEHVFAVSVVTVAGLLTGARLGHHEEATARRRASDRPEYPAGRLRYGTGRTRLGEVRQEASGPSQPRGQVPVTAAIVSTTSVR